LNELSGNKSFSQSAFTTERKKPRTTINISRKGSIVKEKLAQLTEIALNLFPNRVVTNEDLKDLIQMYIGADKETVRNYMGYFGHIRAGRCGDNRVVGLSRKGYLETFGFMHRSHGNWVIHAQSVLSSQDMNSGLESNEKISISHNNMPITSWKGSEGKLGTVSPSSNELEEEEDTEKERNFSPMIYPKILDISLKDIKQLQLNPLEKAILRAKPCEEPDRSKVDWGDQKPKIPEPEETQPSEAKE
jgi:hypothetical protein